LAAKVGAHLGNLFPNILDFALRGFARIFGDL
jgi:hypothetical protein